MDYSSFVVIHTDPFESDCSKDVPKREFDDNSAGLERKPRAEKEECTSMLMDELNRVTTENKKLKEMLATICDKFHGLSNHFTELVNKKNSETNQNEQPSRKRKPESDDCISNRILLRNVYPESSSGYEDNYHHRHHHDHHHHTSYKIPVTGSLNRTKVSKFYVPTSESDNSLNVKDGYKWRKYGQKVTRDNPSPRAYFKCFCTPTCTVKKKVQKSVEDPSILIVTYEGTHNHQNKNLKLNLFQTDLSVSSTRCGTNGSGSNTMMLDLVCDDPKPVRESNNEVETMQHVLVRQMASSLTKDPNFTAAVAAAISGDCWSRQTHPLQNGKNE